MELTKEDLPRILRDLTLTDPSGVFKRDMLDKLAYAAMSDDGSTWFECCRVLKQQKMFREVDKRVQARIREMRKIPSIGGPPRSERSISEIWPGAPVSDDVYVPERYTVADSVPAIERIEQRMMGDSPYEKRVAVSHDPIVITRQIFHQQQRGLLLEVQFRRSSGWKKYVAQRDVFFNARKIVDTASMGMPVSSGNALEMTDWLRAYETANRDRIPRGYASSSMGWQGEDDDVTHHGFLCGVHPDGKSRQIGGNGRAIELEGGEGDMAEAKEIRTRGKLENWIEAVGKLVHFPQVLIGLCAAIAPPLIAIVGAPSGIVEWAGRTSTGKSTVLQVAQSCWRNASYDLTTWDTTKNAAEAAAAFMCDLPLIIDDTATAASDTKMGHAMLAQAIYQLVAGRARGRAARDGSQRIRNKWRTLVMMSGEAPVGEIVKKEGAAARVLTFWGPPLGAPNDATKDLVTRSIRDLSSNYGHAGPRVVQWLCENRDQWDNLRALYVDATERALRTICTPAAARLSSVVALLECAAWVGAMSGCMPWLRGSLMAMPEVATALKSAMTLASSSSDRAYDAWEYVVSDALSHPKLWTPWGEVHDKDRESTSGWYGYRAKDEWAWYPPQIEKILRNGGFEPKAALRAWKDLGVLIKPEKSRFTSQVRPRLDREKLRLIRVSAAYPGHEMEEEEESARAETDPDDRWEY